MPGSWIGKRHKALVNFHRDTTCNYSLLLDQDVAWSIICLTFILLQCLHYCSWISKKHKALVSLQHFLLQCFHICALFLAQEGAQCCTHSAFLKLLSAHINVPYIWVRMGPHAFTAAAWVSESIMFNWYAIYLHQVIHKTFFLTSQVGHVSAFVLCTWTRSTKEAPFSRVFPLLDTITKFSIYAVVFSGRS